MSSQAAAMTAFLLLSGVAIRLFIATRRTSSLIGRSAYGFGGDLRQRSAQVLFRVSIAAALAALALHAARPGFTVTAPLLDIGPAAKALGLALAFSGAALTLFARSDMGRRWRVGVPGEAPDGLVTQGLFAYSRNPVFVGMIAMAAGSAAAVPSLPMIAAAAAFVAACRIQVGDEERLLAGAFGDEYDRYRATVRRWL